MSTKLLLTFAVLTLLLIAAICPSLAQNQTTITIKDFEGDNALPRARLVITNTVNSEDEKELTADGNGIVVIDGIDPNAEYIVEVYWKNPDYSDEEALVFQRKIKGDTLLSLSEIRAHVFDVEVIPLDREGEPLWEALTYVVEEPAVAYLDGVKKVDNEMPFDVSYELVPQGKHRLRIVWLGYTVYDEEVEIGLKTLEGYIPGIDDEGRYRMNLERVKTLIAITNTTSIDITVTDPNGNPVSASIDLLDIKELYLTDREYRLGVLIWVDYANDGHVVWGQLPITEFRVTVRSPFNLTEVLAVGKCVPGQPCNLVLDPSLGPYYILKIRVVSEYGVPVEKAIVELNEWRQAADANGTAVYTCVRPGNYTLRVFLGEREVYRNDALEVEKSGEIEVTIKVEALNVNITLVTEDMRPYEVIWSLDSLEGAHYDSGGNTSSVIRIENIQPGTYELTIFIPEYGLEYKLGPFAAESLAAMETLLLPIADTKIVLSTPEGEPAVGYLVRLCIKNTNICFENETNENGEAFFESLPHQKLYNLTIYFRGRYLGTYDLTMTSPIIPLEIPSESVSPTPQTVTVTETITQTVTTTKETTVRQTVTQTNVREATKTVTKMVTKTEVVKEGGALTSSAAMAIVIAGVIMAVAVAVAAISLTRMRRL